MPLKTFPFDGSRYITSEEAELDFIRDALETGDERHLAHVVGLIARARARKHRRGYRRHARGALQCIE